jgi:hypothetical protein
MAIVIAIIIALIVDFRRGSRALTIVSRASSSTRITLKALIILVFEL